MKSLKSLITGISGFVGPYLTAKLLSEGDTVCGIDRKGKNLESKGKEFENCSIYSCNITDRQDVIERINDLKPDRIFHLAGQSSVEKSWDKPELTQKINVEGTQNLLDAVLMAKLHPKILIVSSAEVYGTPKKTPIKEAQPVNPESPYAKSRVAQEKIAMGYYKKGLNIMVSRSFNHTGPGQPPVFVCSDFAKQIADAERGYREPVMYVGNLDAKRDFTDVRDVVSAYVLALKKAQFGEIYNICSGNAYSIREMLGMLLKLSKTEIEVKQDKSRLRKADSPVLQGDNSKFAAATGWQPKIAIEQTLKDLLDYWRNS